MTMFHSTIRIVTDSGKRAETATILQTMSERIRLLSGCASCRAYNDVRDDHILMLETIWENEADMNRCLRSEDFRNVLFAMEMAVEMPEIRFASVMQVTGMEAIEKARSGE